MGSNNRGLKVFFMVSYGIPILMIPFLTVAFSNGIKRDLFPLVWMLMPATGVIFSKLIDKEINQNLIPKNFYISFIISMIAMIFLAIVSVFIDIDLCVILANLVIFVMSIVGIIQIFKMDKEVRKNNGLDISINWRLGFGLVLLFVVVYLFRIGFNILINVLLNISSFENLIKDININFIYIMLIPVFFASQIVLFFGEEYGWRYFLQPIMQKKFGLRKGVVLLGILWGIWHLPLNFLYYAAPNSGLQSLISQIIACIALGIFFAYVYMKTKNIWLVSFLHFLNNFLAFIISGNQLVNLSIDWTDVVITVITYIVLYFPFLFRKEFKKV